MPESDELFLKESPYRPPEADLQPAREVFREKKGQQRFDPTKIDPTLAVQYPFSKPQWWKTALLLGVLQLVPLLGIAVAYGWMLRIYDDVREGSGDPMPDVSVGEDFGRGLRLMGIVMVCWLVMVGGIMAVMLLIAGLMGVVGAIGGEEVGTAIGSVVAMGLMVLLMFSMIGIYVLMPELMRRCFNGDWFGMLRWNKAVRVIIAHPLPYLTLLASMLLAVILLYSGMFALYLGILFSMPIGMAVGVHAMAQWDRFLEHDRTDYR